MPRPGVETLELLANPLNATILERLASGPKRLTDLRKASGAAPQTTLRIHLKALEKTGVAELREDRPRITEWELTDAGRDLLEVASSLDHWLQAAPEGPLSLVSDAGKMAVKALVGGWSSTIVCLLAAGPLTLTELAACINRVSYPALERRLSAMWLVGQLDTVERDGKGKPYELSGWLRQGVTPMAAAIRWEYGHRPEPTEALSRSDVEAALLLAVPLSSLSPNLQGTCDLGVEANDDDGRYCGVSATVKGGKVVSCSTTLESDPDATATGTPAQWARAVIHPDEDALELSGTTKLASAVVDGLRRTLFGEVTAPQPIH